MQFLTFGVRGVDELVAELFMGWVDPWVGLGWVGSQKMDPWTTVVGPLLSIHAADPYS